MTEQENSDEPAKPRRRKPTPPVEGCIPLSMRHWIEAELARRGWTRAELARAADVDTGELSRVMNQQCAVGMRILHKIAAGFGVEWHQMHLADDQPPVRSVIRDYQTFERYVKAETRQHEQRLLAAARELAASGVGPRLLADLMQRLQASGQGWSTAQIAEIRDTLAEYLQP